MSPLDQFRLHIAFAFALGFSAGVLCVLGTLAVGI